MTEKRYTNREINSMLQRIEEKVQEHFEASKDAHESLRNHIDAGFARIEAAQKELGAKQDYTNGNVRWAKEKIYMGMGALVVLSGVFTFWLKDYIEFRDARQESIESAIDRALDNYQFQIVE